MRRTTLITAALLALLLAPALQAQYGGYRTPDGYGNRYPDGTSNSYPDYDHMDRVSVLAHEIDATARNIYRLAARNNRRPDQYEAQMLQDLYNLYGRAAHFHDEAESYSQDPEHTADDFNALEEAFNQLGTTMQYVHPRSYVDRGMQRIYSLMTELSRYYGRNGYDQWGRYGHNRHDGDRYDRGRNPYDRNYNHDNGYRPPQY